MIHADQGNIRHKNNFGVWHKKHKYNHRRLKRAWERTIEGTREDVRKRTGTMKSRILK